MNEITKLYENAGIEKEVIKGCYEYYAENGGIDIYTVNDCKNKDCNTCKADKSIKEYPPFTAEKQIELIKLLMKQEDFSWTVAQQGKDTKYVFYVGYEYGSGDFKEFTEALAGIINDLWAMQYLTIEEKQQVKGILE